VKTTYPDDAAILFERQRKRLGPALLASFASHLAILLLALVAVRFGTPAATTVAPSFQANSHIIWLTQPGPGGGGGGGGNRMPSPPRQAQEPGNDSITVPVAKAPALEAPRQAAEEPDLVARLTIPAANLAAALESLPGAIDAPPAATFSQGPGTGGGAGPGAGRGIGPGTGPGLGPGAEGGTGNRAYQPGNDVSLPRLLRDVKPMYTSDAVRARVQGTVLLQCVVNTKGEVTDVKVLRSLDAAFGLDQEAIRAARQWRFAPGTRLGEPVAVVVSIELGFSLR
jgi:protein TonB